MRKSLFIGLIPLFLLACTSENDAQKSQKEREKELLEIMLPYDEVQKNQPDSVSTDSLK